MELSKTFSLSLILNTLILGRCPQAKLLKSFTLLGLNRLYVLCDLWILLSKFLVKPGDFPVELFQDALFMNVDSRDVKTGNFSGILGRLSF